MVVLRLLARLNPSQGAVFGLVLGAVASIPYLGMVGNHGARNALAAAFFILGTTGLCASVGSRLPEFLRSRLRRRELSGILGSTWDKLTRDLVKILDRKDLAEDPRRRRLIESYADASSRTFPPLRSTPRHAWPRPSPCLRTCLNRTDREVTRCVAKRYPRTDVRGDEPRRTAARSAARTGSGRVTGGPTTKRTKGAALVAGLLVAVVALALSVLGVWPAGENTGTAAVERDVTKRAAATSREASPTGTQLPVAAVPRDKDLSLDIPALECVHDVHIETALGTEEAPLRPF